MRLSANELNHSRQSSSQSLLPNWHIRSRYALFRSQLTYIPIYIIWINKPDKMALLFVNLSHPIGPTHEYRKGKTDQVMQK